MAISPAGSLELPVLQVGICSDFLTVLHSDASLNSDALEVHVECSFISQQSIAR